MGWDELEEDAAFKYRGFLINLKEDFKTQLSMLRLIVLLIDIRRHGQEHAWRLAD